jgi:hypothetical protein
MACRPGLIMRGRSLIMYSNVHRPPRAASGRGRVARPLQGQRGSYGRHPLLTPPTRRMWAAVGQVTSPATPAPRMTMKAQTLCQRARGNAGLLPKYDYKVLPSAYRPQTSWLTTNSTFISVLGFSARGTGRMALASRVQITVVFRPCWGKQLSSHCDRIAVIRGVRPEGGSASGPARRAP